MGFKASIAPTISVTMVNISTDESCSVYRKPVNMGQLHGTEESGLAGVDASIWTVAPAGTPAVIVNQIHAEVAATLKPGEMRERLGALGPKTVSMSRALFHKPCDRTRSATGRSSTSVRLEVQR